MSEFAAQRRWSAAQALVAALACAAVAYACTRYGPAVDNDSADFFSAADSLASGGGWIMTTGRLFILWPPLHPLLLAGFAGLGIGHGDASLILNLAALFVTLWVGARLITRLSGSPALGLLWGLVVAVAPDLFWIHTRALSEAPFLAFCTLAVSGCCLYLEQPRLRYFALMTLGAGAAWVERYAGMVLLPVLGACLLWAPVAPSSSSPTSGAARLLPRFKRSLAFVILAGLPMLPWVVRNVVHTRQLTGDRGSFGEFGMPAAEALTQSTRTILAWFAPSPSPATSGLALAALAVVLGGCWLARATPAHGTRLSWLPLLAFPLVYFAFTDVININYEIDGLGPRQMLPALPAVWTLVLLAGHRAWGGWRARASAWGRAPRLIPLLAIGAYLSVAGPATLARTRELHSAGAGYYSTERWQTSPLLRAARDLPARAELYSNDVYALYLFTGQRSTPLPSRPRRFETLARRLAEEQRSLQVVWVRTNERNRLPIERMQKHVVISTVLEAQDGLVYRIDPR